MYSSVIVTISVLIIGCTCSPDIIALFMLLYEIVFTGCFLLKTKNLCKKRKVNKRLLFIKSQFCWYDKLGLLMKKMLHIFLPYIFQIVCVVIFLLCAIYGFFMKWLSYGSCYIYETAVPFIQPLLYGRSVFTGVDKGL